MTKSMLSYCQPQVNQSELQFIHDKKSKDSEQYKGKRGSGNSDLYIISGEI